MFDPKDKDDRTEESGSSTDWQWGGPPSHLSEGQYMERYGSTGGGIQQEYTSVATRDGGSMIIQKTSEQRSGDYIEVGHATKHEDTWFDRYPSKDGEKE